MNIKCGAMLLAIFGLLFLTPYALRAQCGSDRDRWQAKTLNDGTHLETIATHTTVAEQNALARPPKWQAQPRFPNELVLDSLEGEITMAGEEGDDDFHLVLSDGTNEMVIEIPSPDNCPEITTHKDEYRTARKNAEQLLGKITGTGIHTVGPKHVTVTGYGFFDKRAHGSGHSINGREIHPVLSIR